jgi:hypothetical protein
VTIEPAPDEAPGPINLGLGGHHPTELPLDELFQVLITPDVTSLYPHWACR